MLTSRRHIKYTYDDANKVIWTSAKKIIGVKEILSHYDGLLNDKRIIRGSMEIMDFNDLNDLILDPVSTRTLVDKMKFLTHAKKINLICILTRSEKIYSKLKNFQTLDPEFESKMKIYYEEVY